MQAHAHEAAPAIAKRKAVVVVVAATLLGMLFAGSFIGALHRPDPHDIPVAVVAPAGAASTMRAALDERSPGALELIGYDSEQSARQALLEQDVDGAFIAEPSGNRLLVAGAAGRTTVNVLTQAFTQASQVQGRQLAVQDVVPLPPDDANGIATMFFNVTLAIPAVALAVLLFLAVPAVGLAGRLLLLAAGSLALAGANTWIVAGLVGALTGAPWALWGIGSLIAFAISGTTAGLLRLAGPPAAALAILAIIPVGVPASGGPVGSRFIPEWYAAVGEALPIGAGITTVRSVIYFDGSGTSTALWVLTLWAVAGVLLVAAGTLRHRTARTAQPRGVEAASPTR